MVVDVRDLLSKLREAIQKVEMDADARASARRLDRDIHAMLDEKGVDADRNSLLRRAAELEEKFSRRYPTVSRIIGELLEAVAKAGS